MRRRSLVLMAVAALAGAPRAARAQDENAALQIAREVTSGVEQAVGLRFRRAPNIQVRSREQVRSYLSRKLVEELPPAELRAVERTYRAFGLVPETTDLRRLMLELYSEQVAGYYDPDSSALFVVRGADPMVLRLIMAHELVHALQDEYTPLNAILKLKRQNDRQMAGQAVAEGQATLASLEALAPGVDLSEMLSDWDLVRQAIRSQQSAMPVFATAPRIIQEGLLFPYLAGAEFMRNFNARRSRTDEEPYGDRMPVSTAQVLHTDLYTSRAMPERVGFGAALSGDTLVYDDDFGEFETRIALETWGLDEPVAVAAAAGWDGDRFEVLGTPAGTAVLWATAWRTPEDAAQFERALESGWSRRTGASGRPVAGGATGADYGGGPAARRWLVERLAVRGVNVVRLVDAPARWSGWARLPGVALSRMTR
jgi:hypothetical protein